MAGRGFSLVEALISSALFSFVIAGVYLLYTVMQTTLDRGQVRADLQQNARVGLARLVQVVRMAGYTGGAATDPLGAAGVSCLSTNGSQITYDLADDAGDPAVPPRKVLRRREGAGIPQPQAEAVAALSFLYYDVDNQPLVPAAPALAREPGGDHAADPVVRGRAAGRPGVLHAQERCAPPEPLSGLAAPPSSSSCWSWRCSCWPGPRSSPSPPPSRRSR
jgi:hypothetical protein